VKRHAPGIADNMLIWRPIIRGRCTLHDLRTVYGYDDLMDLHESLNLEDAIKTLPPVNAPTSRR
jgi:hypothetical protein